MGTPIDTWAWAASLGDMVVGAACNPHTYLPRGKGKINAGASRRETQSFVRWRRTLFDADNVFVPARIVDDGTVWGRYYARMRHHEPVVTTLALAYGLEPNPARRIDMQSMAAFCALLVQADAWDDRHAEWDMQQLLPEPKILLWVAQLRRIAGDSRTR